MVLRQNLIIVLAIILAAGLIGAFLSYQANATGPFVLPAITAATSSAVAVGPDEDIQIVASSSRSYLYIANDTGVGDVYCKADGDKAAALNEGIKISTSTAQFYEFFIEKNPYDGAVRCMATASTTLVVTEFRRN